MALEIAHGPLGWAARSVFGLGSRIRGARIVHPEGVGFTGELRIERELPGHDRVPAFQGGERRAVLARFSRSIGLPEPLPDLLGFSLRVEDGYGPGEDLDLPLISSADGLGHFLLLPTLSGFLAGHYSSVMLYEVGGERRVIGAIPRTPEPLGSGPRAIRQLEETFARGPLRFDLAVATPTGSFCPFGEILLDRRLPDEETEAICFNPARSGGGIRALGPLMGIRGAAYVGSQRARGALSLESEVKRRPHPRLNGDGSGTSRTETTRTGGTDGST